MKIKLAYPKIPDALYCPLKSCVAFNKMDGTCMVFYWDPEFGFHDVGTRRDRFADNTLGWLEFAQAHPGLEGVKEAFQTIRESLAAHLTQHFPNTSVIIFAEYHGPNSFAGQHHSKDIKQLTIFDVQVDGMLLPPEQFIQLFGSFPIPKVVFQGKFTGQLFIDVRNGKYPVNEGIVVKGMVNGQVYMAKIKTTQYLERLKDKFKDNWRQYWE